MLFDKTTFNKVDDEDTKKIEKPTKEQEEFAAGIRDIFQSIIDNEGLVDDETEESESDENDSDLEGDTDKSENHCPNQKESDH